MSLDAFLVPTGIVALAEIGDKTQLLALLLAARFRKPWPIVIGILVATILNHALAGAIGTWLVDHLGRDALRWGLGIGFLAMAGWMLVPDKVDADEVRFYDQLGAFGATLIAFFLAEMGDKTQIATVALAAKYHDMLAVVAGTTLGMLIADAPAVWVGDRLSRALPVTLIHRIAATLFAVIGIWVLVAG